MQGEPAAEPDSLSTRLSPTCLCSQTMPEPNLAIRWGEKRGDSLVLSPTPRL